MEHAPVIAKLLAGIEEHRQTSQKLAALDDFSNYFLSSRQSLSQLPEHKGAHFRQTAERYARTLERFIFVSLVCRRKIDAVTQLIRYSIDSQNAIALAQGSRSLVEHVAVQAEIALALDQFSQKIKGQTDGSKIHDVISKAEDFVNRCYFGKSPKIAHNKTEQALHVSDCIDTLESDLPGITKAYNFLCEFVHPNHGSNSLVSTSDITEQITSITCDLSRPEVQRMAEIALTTLGSSEIVESRGHAAIALLGFYTQRFKQQSSKISNIFAERKIKPVGDGRSKETALFFPDARDAKESVELWAQYLERRKIKVTDRRLAAMEGNSAYDLYETTQGQLWHRIDYPKDSVGGRA